MYTPTKTDISNNTHTIILYAIKYTITLCLYKFWTQSSVPLLISLLFYCCYLESLMITYTLKL